MTPSEYQHFVSTLEAMPDEALHNRLCNASRLLHGVIGLTTETGELADGVKRYVWYGREVDLANIAEELGDLAFYLGVICNALGLDLEKVLELNRDKLTKRYGEKFTQEKALNRDLEGERKVLEGKAG